MADLSVVANCNSWAILRTIIIYGKVENMSRGNLVLWVYESLKAGKEINVIDDQFRSPTFVDDLAWACLKVATERTPGIFNISGPETKSIYDLALEIAETFHLDTNLIKRTNSVLLNQPANRPPKTGFNLEKAINILGYKPHTFKEGISKMILGKS
jgi:dTDP-4-dehydrorhamnose reductase